MTTQQLNNKLRQLAIANGLCDKWQSDWLSDKSREELLEMYKRGMDFCIENDYPSVEFIKDNFDKDLLNRFGVFCDENISPSIRQSGVYVFNGKCSGNFIVSGFSVVTIYVRHNTSISVVASDMCKVFIHAYDNARINIIADEMAKVFTYQHSDNAHLTI